ncbi:MAG TPA: CobD/CbiB family protein [Burkholderiales bacterium]|jgi:cobalamin biosynthesis protein CobD/CbiB|nr:CobD/CbiB family protein [Burkholderiales bacterium]
MTFISLVAALLLEQLRPLRSGNRIYGEFARYVDWLARNLNAGQYRDGVIAWLLAMAPPALITLSVYALCRHMGIVFAVLWNVVVLYLALGFRQFSHFYNDVMQALRNADLTRAREALTQWRGESARELSASEAARVAIELGLVRSHRHVFGVMAWFVVLGPVGAIGYRLAALLNDRWGVARDAQTNAYGRFAERAFEVIDWVPVRLTAIGFAFAGDFMGAVECWREHAVSWRSRSEGILLAAAAGALGVKLGGVLHQDNGIEYRPQLGDGDEADVDYMQAAVGLIWRALVLWCFLILLATIASWF